MAMVSRRIIISTVVIVAVLAVSIVYYVNTASYTGTVATTTKSTTTSVIVNIVGTGPSSNAPMNFSPLNFTVTEGEHVTLALNNTDSQPHELVIPQFNLTTGIVQGGTTVRVSFVPNRVGNFPFYQPVGPCSPGNASPPIACPRVEVFNGTMTVLPD